MDAASRALVRLLDDAVPLLSADERRQREAALAGLQSVATEWLAHRAAKLGGAFTPPARVLVFGSHCLGVDGPDDDVDVVLLAPRHAANFFDESDEGFVGRLRGHAHVRTVQTIPGAYVPLCVVRWGGVKLDVAHALVPAPEAGLPDMHALASCDEVSLLSLGGPRLAAFLLDYVASALDEFRIVLRALRLWARCVLLQHVGAAAGLTRAVRCVPLLAGAEASTPTRWASWAASTSLWWPPTPSSQTRRQTLRAPRRCSAAPSEPSPSGPGPRRCGCTCRRRPQTMLHGRSSRGTPRRTALR